MEEGRLNEKQAAFVREYVKDFNATQAAVRAGYSAKSAPVNGPRLLANAGIQKAIEKMKVAVCARAELTTDRIVQELERIAFGNLKNSVDWDSGGTSIKASSDLPDDVSATIMAIEEDEHETTSPTGATHTRRKVKVKHYDKLRALELLARYKGMLVDRKELTGKDGKPIQVQQKTWVDLMAEEEAE